MLTADVRRAYPQPPLEPNQPAEPEPLPEDEEAAWAAMEDETEDGMEEGSVEVDGGDDEEDETDLARLDESREEPVDQTTILVDIRVTRARAAQQQEEEQQQHLLQHQQQSRSSTTTATTHRRRCHPPTRPARSRRPSQHLAALPPT